MEKYTLVKITFIKLTLGEYALVLQMKRAPAYDYEKYDKIKYDEQYDKIISMMMGGLKGGERELAADGGGAGPLAVSHRR